MLKIYYIVISGVGGIARYLHEYSLAVKDNPEHKIHVTLLLSTIVISGFSGYIYSQIGEYLALPTNLNSAFAGIGGALGMASVQFL